MVLGYMSMQVYFLGTIKGAPLLEVFRHDRNGSYALRVSGSGPKTGSLTWAKHVGV